MRKKHKKYLEGFRLIRDTAGKICNGVYVSEDNSELIIEWAWGGRIHYASQEKLPKDGVQADFIK